MFTKWTTVWLVFLCAHPALAQTPLLEAVFNNDLAAVKAAIQDGGSVQAKDETGYSVLYHAIANGSDATMVTLLIDQGADVNSVEPEYKMPMLNHAAAMGDEAVVALLLRKGAKPDATDQFGGTALEEAAYYGEQKIAKLLLRAGSKTRYPAHVAAGLGDVTMLKHQLDAVEGELPVTPGWKNSALHFAAAGQQMESVKLLLQAKQDPNIANRFGNTPLHEAASTGNAAILKLLLDAGAKASIKNMDGETPVDYAADENTAELLATNEETFERK